jgi:hypothetical protein
MTVLEQRFLERVPNELHLLNENLEKIINLLSKLAENGANTR